MAYRYRGYSLGQHPQFVQQPVEIPLTKEHIQTIKQHICNTIANPFTGQLYYFEFIDNHYKNIVTEYEYVKVPQAQFYEWVRDAIQSPDSNPNRYKFVYSRRLSGYMSSGDYRLTLDPILEPDQVILM